MRRMELALMNVRRRLSAVTAFALVALAACSPEGLVAPADQELDWGVVDYEQTLRDLNSMIDLSSVSSARMQQFIDQMRDADGGGEGPSRSPTVGQPPLDIIVFLYAAAIWVYENGYFSDGESLRLDRLIVILKPIVYAYGGLLAGDDDQAIAGLETAIEWFEQRVEEGMVPAGIGQFLIDCALDAIEQLGGPNTTKTFCLTSAERSCVTGILNSIRWESPILATRLSHDFSYSFLDGAPAGIDMAFEVVTPSLMCAGPSPPAARVTLTSIVRLEPTQTANPNTGGSFLIPCDPFGIIIAFEWDGIVIRDTGGNVTASCSKSDDDPCWEPVEEI